MESERKELSEKIRKKTTIPEEYLEIARSYLENPAEYVQEFVCTINGKLRHITTYAKGEKGLDLRKLHTWFSKEIKGRYTSSRYSFAYKKGSNILKCVEWHTSSSAFLKADIHAYFDSIRHDLLVKRIMKSKTCRESREEYELIIRACFFDGKVPIGFISSPVLSDIYLSGLDNKYSKIGDICYTRYADDFIISSDNKDVLSGVRARLEEDLLEYGLELNKKKTYIRELKHVGDSIHVLGINLVREEAGSNRLTISDKYLRAISMEYGKWMKNRQSTDAENEQLPKLKGMIRFVRDCSEDSYQKLRKIVSIKCGEDIADLMEGNRRQKK